MTKAFAVGRAGRWSLWIAPLLGGLAAAPVTAQVRGTVLDRSERPVGGAVVELWDDSRHAAGTRTDEQGRFQLPGGSAEGQSTLTVRRLGLATRTLPLTSRDTTLRIDMQEQAVWLRPLTVQAQPGRLCPRREDPQAREVWNQMRSRYWQPGPDPVFVFGFLELRSGTGEKSDAYDPGAGRTSAGWTTGALVMTYPELMARSGYAVQAAGGAGDRIAFWSYRALDGGMMQDFTGDYFGSAHTFSVLSRDAGQTTLVFCPRDRMRRTGQVQGTLTVRADTTLLSARWTFQTPDTPEDAGGEACYLPPDPAFGRALLAGETVFWRRSERAYYFEAKTFTGWRRWFPEPRAPSAAQRER
jgi:hypothetical protein